jgi:hypothetical protein
MNRIAVCLAGLALLSQTPIALASPPSWTAANQVTPFVDAVNSAHASASVEFASDQQPAIQASSSDGSTPIAPVPPPSMQALPNQALPNQVPPAPVSPTQSAQPIGTDLGVEFDLSNSVQNSAQPAPTSPPVQVSTPSVTAPPVAAPPLNPPVAQFDSAKIGDFSLSDLFSGNSDSLVAVAVGSAEGTRSPDGGRNKAFYGHTDPGNGVWNLGTFSYQHGAASADEADAKQLDRLMQQAQIIQDKAAQKGMRLTLAEALNGIDLANQAPKAVLDSVGYVEWLSEAYARGMKGSDAILWARVQSFFDPKQQRWNAPGLGNTADSIAHDQQRRMEAIARAIDAKNYSISSDARLRPQPISFRLPNWGFVGRFVGQATHKLAMLMERL